MCYQTESAASLLDNDRVVDHFPENFRAKLEAYNLPINCS